VLRRRRRLIHPPCFAVSVSVLLLAAILSACGNDDGEPPSPTASPGAPDVTVIASDLLAFEPAEVRVRSGERVRLVLDNRESSALHDLIVDEIPVQDVDEQSVTDDRHGHGAGHGGHGDGHDGHGPNNSRGLHVAAAAGEVGTVEFTPTEPGEYRFYCSVPGHERGGMAGLLIVE
jgi:uncharacterized cupredoxin-like copper-binding protein